MNGDDSYSELTASSDIEELSIVLWWACIAFDVDDVERWDSSVNDSMPVL